MRGSTYLLKAVRRVTREGLLCGSLPRSCPLCGNPVRELVIYHWGGGGAEAVLAERYRRMCSSCSKLLKDARDVHNAVWKEQLQFLRTRVESCARKQYPCFPREEEWWSLLTEREWLSIWSLVEWDPSELARGLSLPLPGIGSAEVCGVVKKYLEGAISLSTRVEDEKVRSALLERLLEVRRYCGQQ